MRTLPACLALVVTLLAACAGPEPPAAPTATPIVQTSVTPSPSASPTVEAARTATTPTPPPATATPTPTTTPTPTPRPTAAPPGIRSTEIRRSTFESPLEVAAGTTIVWTNQEGVAHTVSAVDGSFDSPFLSADQQFGQVFTRPGTVDLFCRVHAGMTGVVVVR